LAVNTTDRPDPSKKVPKAKLSHSQELLRIIEEYANGLREIIRKLRKKLN
jgi:hypothetical protein